MKETPGETGGGALTGLVLEPTGEAGPWAATFSGVLVAVVWG